MSAIPSAPTLSAPSEAPVTDLDTFGRVPWAEIGQAARRFGSVLEMSDGTGCGVLRRPGLPPVGVGADPSVSVLRWQCTLGPLPDDGGRPRWASGLAASNGAPGLGRLGIDRVWNLVLTAETPLPRPELGDLSTLDLGLCLVLESVFDAGDAYRRRAWEAIPDQGWPATRVGPRVELALPSEVARATVWSEAQQTVAGWLRLPAGDRTAFRLAQPPGSANSFDLPYAIDVTLRPETVAVGTTIRLPKMPSVDAVDAVALFVLRRNAVVGMMPGCSPRFALLLGEHPTVSVVVELPLGGITAAQLTAAVRSIVDGYGASRRELRALGGDSALAEIFLRVSRAHREALGGAAKPRDQPIAPSPRLQLRR